MTEVVRYCKAHKKMTAVMFVDAAPTLEDSLVLWSWVNDKNSYVQTHSEGDSWKICTKCAKGGSDESTVQ